MSVLYTAVFILYSSCCTKYIEVNWPKKQVKSSLEKVRKFQKDYQEAVSLPTSSISVLYNRRLNKPRELNMFDQIAQSLKQVAWPASQDKYKDYNSEELYKLSTGVSALIQQYYNIRRQQYPRLLYIAIDILSIPAISNKPEYVFSGACCTILQEREQLNPETIEIIECFKYWKKSRILDKFLESEDEQDLRLLYNNIKVLFT